MARLEARLSALEAPLLSEPIVVRCVSLVGQVGQPETIRRVGSEQAWKRASNETTQQFRSRVDEQLGTPGRLIVLAEQNFTETGELE